MIAGRYRALLVSPGVVPLLVAGLVARLPFGMYSLAILLLVQRQTGSYAGALETSGTHTYMPELAAQEGLARPAEAGGFRTGGSL